MKEPKEPIGLKVGDLLKEEIRDKHGRPCPKDLPRLLREAGVVSFSGRPSGLDWDVVRSDATILRDRLGKVSRQ